MFGCGNSMMTRATALAGVAPFDVEADQTGGEDDRLFARLRARGARFAWAAGASVDEHAPPHRAKIRYAFARMISYGQSPTQLARRRGDVVDALKWGVVGLMQALGYGLAALALLLLGRARWLDMAGAAAGGLGKMLWFAHLHFYGQGALKSAPKAASGEERLAARPAHG
jgi:hypothetical protein